MKVILLEKYLPDLWIKDFCPTWAFCLMLINTNYPRH